MGPNISSIIIEETRFVIGFKSYKLANILENTPVRFVSHLVPMSDMVKKGEEARISTLFDMLSKKKFF